jgi:prepilin-type N-terminal cleavage/methylation domain-containing protein
MRMTRKAVAQSGFTLIELLITIATIMVLSGIALTGFTVYKEQAYIRMEEQMMQQARTALEAGKQDSESFPDEAIIVDQRTPGPMADDSGKQLLPGLTLPPEFRVYAKHDPTCSDSGCMEDYLITRSCHTHKKVVYFHMYQGVEATMSNVDDADPC